MNAEAIRELANSVSRAAEELGRAKRQLDAIERTNNQLAVDVLVGGVNARYILQSNDGKPLIVPGGRGQEPIDAGLLVAGLRKMLRQRVDGCQWVLNQRRAALDEALAGRSP